MYIYNRVPLTTPSVQLGNERYDDNSSNKKRRVALAYRHILYILELNKLELCDASFFEVLWRQTKMKKFTQTQLHRITGAFGLLLLLFFKM